MVLLKMSNAENLETYRVIWLFGSVLVIVSFFLSYVYDRTLINTMQSNMPGMFDFLSNPPLENITTTVVDIDFILLMFGAALSLLYSLLTIKSSGARFASRFKLWNASTLELTGLVLFSSPILLYENGKLVQVLSFLGTEYFPNFDGFGAGYFLTWFGVIVSIFAGRQVTRIARLIDKEKHENQA
jgi:hypothetical protein